MDSTTLPPISELCRFLDREPPSFPACYEESKPDLWNSCGIQRSFPEAEGEQEQRFWTVYPQSWDQDQMTTDSNGYQYGFLDDGQQPPSGQVNPTWAPMQRQQANCPEAPLEAEIDLDLTSTDDDTEDSMGPMAVDPDHLIQPPTYDYAMANRQPYQPPSENSDLYYYATTADSLWACQNPNGPMAHDQTTISINGTGQPKKKPGRRPGASEEVPSAPKPSKKQRRRVPNQHQRKAANIRERRRMFNLNAAFDTLRKRVPTFAYEKNLSRIETLKLAISYIQFMDNLLVESHVAECASSWVSCNGGQ